MTRRIRPLVTLALSLLVAPLPLAAAPPARLWPGSSRASHGRAGMSPGVTNIPNHSFLAKHLELLREAVPGITRVALLLYALDPFNARRIPPVETAAKTLGVHLHLVYVESPHDFEAAFSAMKRQGVDGLLVSFTPFFGPHRAQIADLAARSRLPAIDGNRSFAEQGPNPTLMTPPAK